MKTKPSCLILALTLLLAGCAYFDVQPGEETWEHRLGRAAAIVVFSNNPGYIPLAKEQAEQGIALVTGEDVDPARVVSGIVEFANRLTQGEYQEYRDLVIEVLDFVKDLVKVNLDIPENKMRVAERIHQFLLGVLEGIERVTP